MNFVSKLIWWVIDEFATVCDFNVLILPSLCKLFIHMLIIIKQAGFTVGMEYYWNIGTHN